MDWSILNDVLQFIQYLVSSIGIFVILSGVLFALVRYLYFLLSGYLTKNSDKINEIRASLGRTLILGLEFIVAADLIKSTTTPDYYSVGILAIIVLIRTFLSYALAKELKSINADK